MRLGYKTLSQGSLFGIMRLAGITALAEWWKVVILKDGFFYYTLTQTMDSSSCSPFNFAFFYSEINSQIFLCLFVYFDALHPSKFFSHVKTISCLPGLFQYKAENITIHHECPCRIEISHPRGRNFNQSSLVKTPAPRVRYLYPTWTGSWWIIFLPLFEGFFVQT